MATLKTIQMEIIRLRAAYPYPDRSVEELKVLTEIWMEDFEFMDDDTFRGAIRDHRKQSKFWPTVADINEQAPLVELKSYQIEWKRERQALTDEEIAKNQEQIRMLIEKIGEPIKDGVDYEHKNKVMSQARTIKRAETA